MKAVKLVLITGLSGSGKSTVAKSFEDLGYYCVDNLPLPLLRTLLENPAELTEGQDRIAIVTDVRAPGFATEASALIRIIDRQRVDFTLLFLEASTEALLRRFSETRRLHPLAGDRPVIEGIRHEREILTELRGEADLIVDTSDFSIHEIRNQIVSEFGSQTQRGRNLVLSLVSFGYKRGIPYGTDLLFDVRFLPNPYFVPDLREQTGRDPEVRAYLERQAEYTGLLDKLQDFLAYLLPYYQRQDRSYLAVAVGCTGGRHRSVAVVEELRRRLEEGGWSVHVMHRDCDRSGGGG